MRLFLLQVLLFIITAHLASIAQTVRNCATMQHLQDQLMADPGLAQRMAAARLNSKMPYETRGTAVITIPVVFHIVYNIPTENINNLNVLAQLDVLNKDFARLNADAIYTPAVFQNQAANTHIQFCLAQRDPDSNATTGITRRQTSVSFFNTNDDIKFFASGGTDAWPATDYLNIWICNLTGNVIGYSQFPGGNPATDGVVLKYSTVGGPQFPGTNFPYHLGRSATHEVGHWLNLLHIWGDSTCGDDQVNDTPNQQNANYGYPAFPHITCTNGPFGDMFMNYMDYTNDACMNLFTSGQSARMNTALTGSRNSLLSSMGCIAPGGTMCGIPINLDASSVTATAALLSWDAVPGANSYTIRYKIVNAPIWTTTTSVSPQVLLTGLINASFHIFQVFAICGSTNGNYSSESSFTTNSCTDTTEPNDEIIQATTFLVSNEMAALISPAGDSDWFTFTTAAPATNFQLLLSGLPDDFDVKLYNHDLRLLSTSQNNSTLPELINHNSTEAATYFVKIYGFNFASDNLRCYSLKVNTSDAIFRMEDNMSNGFKDDLTHGLITVPNPANDEAVFEFLSENASAGLITVYDIPGQLIYKNKMDVAAGINRVRLDVKRMSSGFYFVVIDTGNSLRKGKFLIQHK